MRRIWTGLAHLTAAAHLSLLALLVAGGPLRLRRPGIVWLHVPAILATAGVFLVGARCPLTRWQKYFLSRAGLVPYEEGFNEHYIVRPLTRGATTPLVDVAIIVAWLLPTVAAYSVSARRAYRRAP